MFNENWVNYLREDIFFRLQNRAERVPIPRSSSAEQEVELSLDSTLVSVFLRYGKPRWGTKLAVHHTRRIPLIFPLFAFYMHLFDHFQKSGVEPFQLFRIPSCLSCVFLASEKKCHWKRVRHSSKLGREDYLDGGFPCGVKWSTIL